MKEKLETYRMNAVMAGVLYFLGTVFGVLSGVIGGEVLSSFSYGKPLVGVDILGLVAANSSRITIGAFLILMMGISLMMMTIFLYPIFRKDSEELATGMVLFRGALEGTFYFLSTLGFLALVLLGNEYIAAGAEFGYFTVHGQCLVLVSRTPRSDRFHLISHWGFVFIHLLLPHSPDPPLVVRLGFYRCGVLDGFPIVEIL